MPSGSAQAADCMCTLLATRCPDATQATRAMPHHLLQLCAAADDACSHAWTHHNTAVTRLRACITAYITHVPKLPALQYVRSTHHSAWLQVLHGLRESTAGSADQLGIAAALLEAPVVTPGALQAAVRPLLATAAVLRHAKDQAALACAAQQDSNANSTSGAPVASRILALSAGSWGALRGGITESLASVISVVATCMQHMHGVRSEAMAERQWRAAPAPQQPSANACTTDNAVPADAWSAWARAPVSTRGSAADTTGLLPRQPSGTNDSTLVGQKARALFVDGQVQGILEQISDVLSQLSEDKEAHHALGDSQMHSALISAAPHVHLLREGARTFQKIGSAASHVVALHAFLTQAFCPCLLTVLSAPLGGVATGVTEAAAGSTLSTGAPVHVVEYYHQIFSEAAMHVRYYLRSLLAAHRKGREYKALMESCAEELREVQQALDDLNATQTTPVATSGHAELATRRSTLLQRQYTLKSVLDRRVTHSTELAVGVAKAASAVRVCMHDVKDALSTSARLQASLQERVAAKFSPGALVKQAHKGVSELLSPLDVDAALAMCGLRQGIEHSAEVFGPLVCGVFNEFAAVLAPIDLAQDSHHDSPRNTTATLLPELQVPASWYTGATLQPPQPSAAPNAATNPANAFPTAFASIHTNSHIWGNNPGSNIWGAPTGGGAYSDAFAANPSHVCTGFGGIWDDLSSHFGGAMDGGLGVSSPEGDPVTWPTSLNDIWTDVAALFAVENLLEAATHLPADSFTKSAQPAAVSTLTSTAAMHGGRGANNGRGSGKFPRASRGRNRNRGDATSVAAASHGSMHAVTLPATTIAASPHALKLLSDEACMCVADVMMASVGALTCSHLSNFISAFSRSPGSAGGATTGDGMWVSSTTPGSHSAAGTHMHAPHAYQPDGVPAGTKLWLAHGDHASTQHSMHDMHASYPAQGEEREQGERQLQAFMHFSSDAPGADMMLGGLSDCGSLEQGSLEDMDGLEAALESFEDVPEGSGGLGTPREGVGEMQNAAPLDREADRQLRSRSGVESEGLSETGMELQRADTAAAQVCTVVFV